MSTNNLALHVSWLLSNKPFAPPPRESRYTVPPTAVEAELQQQDESQQPQPDCNLNNQQETIAALRGATLSALGVNTSNMARLRSIPSPSKKPRLLIQNSCTEPEAPSKVYGTGSSSALRPQSDSISRSSTKRHVDSTPSKKYFPLRDVETPGFDVTGMDIDVVDLTEMIVDGPCGRQSQQNAPAHKTIPQSPGLPTVPSTGNKSGRKRRSNEYEADLYQTADAGNATTRRPSSGPTISSQGFIGLDNAVPEEPPPPYSTVAAPADDSYSPYFSQSSDSVGQPNEIERPCDQHSPHEEETHLSPRHLNDTGLEHLSTPNKCKNNAACHSASRSDKIQDSGGRRTSSTFWTSPCPTRTKGRQSDAVLDSEDESWYGIDSNAEVTAATNDNTLDVLHESLPAKQKSPPPLPFKLDISPRREKHGPSPRPQLSTAISPTLETPTTIVRANSSFQTSVAPASGRSFKALPAMELTANCSAIVRAFSEWTATSLQDYFDKCQEDLKASSRALAMAMINTGMRPTDMLESVTRKRGEIRALEELVDLREKHCRLSQRKRDLLEKLVLDISEGHEHNENHPSVLECNAINATLGRSEMDLEPLIERTGLPVSPSPLQHTVREPAESAIAVHSTQKRMVRPASQRPQAERFVHTQLVEQTQSSGWQSPSETGPKSRSGPPLHNQLAKASITTPVCFGGKDLTSKTSHGFATQNNRNTSTTFMGSPPTRLGSDEPNYGLEDDEEEMLDVVENLDFSVLSSPAKPAYINRKFSTEISGSQLGRPDPPAKERETRITSHSGLQLSWSKDVKWAMIQKFRLQGFRTNQLEAINATLNGEDVFVLMPTGGGKSLCYQLPSVINSGKTRGLTVVVSPLLSLMEDQTAALKKIGIGVALLNGDTSKEERSQLFRDLRNPGADNSTSLLYLTPEMLTKSQVAMSVLQDLHSEQRLARLVIDEAHCVSQWGHDFRPDYKALGEIRQRFEGVPLMALTATATENVKVDVISNLCMQNCKVFTQSFNRPNLTYEVRQKPKGKGCNTQLLQHIAELITTRYKNQSGIIYCLSRKTCEETAKELREKYSIKAHHYHAGLEAMEKRNVQQAWQTGTFHVIVATIAFGMGIDKPDVRFVIHHSLPKSLEGYYQETGRAGRDGKRSGCYLYFGQGDCMVLRTMIDKAEIPPELKERQIQVLRKMIQYCENKSDCRRVQVLAYFNETFAKKKCNGACDHCTSNSRFETIDLTEDAQAAVRMVSKLQNEDITLIQCVDLFCGSKAAKLARFSHVEEFGLKARRDRNIVQRLFHRLVNEGALKEINKRNKARWPIQYICTGRNSREFLRGTRPVKMEVQVDSPGQPRTRDDDIEDEEPPQNPAPRAARTDHLASTNISSPVQARAAPKQGIRQQRSLALGGTHINSRADRNERIDEAIDLVGRDDGPEDEFESGDEFFGSIRNDSRNREARKKALGSAIELDEQMENLNETHQHVVAEFVHRAKDLCRDILMKKGLRKVPFTETILRAMAIYFPKDEEEMLQLRGVDPEEVKLYGREFLKLIKSTEQSYNEMMNREADRPMDPNHQTIVDLVSDDEGARNERDGDQEFDYGDDALADFEYDFASDDDFGGEGSQQKRSPFFGQDASTTTSYGINRAQAQHRETGHHNREPRQYPRGGGKRAGRKGSIARGKAGKVNVRKSSGGFPRDAARSAASKRKTNTGAGRAQKKNSRAATAGPRQAAGGIGMMPV